MATLVLKFLIRFWNELRGFLGAALVPARFMLCMAARVNREKEVSSMDARTTQRLRNTVQGWGRFELPMTRINTICLVWSTSEKITH